MVQCDDALSGQFRVGERCRRFVTARGAADMQRTEPRIERYSLCSHRLDEHVARQAERLLIEKEPELVVCGPAVRQLVAKWTQSRNVLKSLHELNRAPMTKSGLFG